MDELEKAIASWASKDLCSAWFLLCTLDYEDGEPVLRKDDIEQLGLYILAAEKEIKSLKENRVVLPIATDGYTSEPEKMICEHGTPGVDCDCVEGRRR